ncbi:MAG: hypothetical protein ABSA46_05625 [Thermodesulfovibrionales bacterium]|jgi:ATP-dependent exoDNAse (exonuclease V) alpha subunit
MLTVEEDLEKVAKVNKNRERTEMFIKALEAETLLALGKYLSSSLFYDIGPVISTRIVMFFGARTAQVIETSVHDLLSVPGVGKKRMLSVKNGWSLQRKLTDQSAQLVRLKFVV